jgi:hypothetical protein
MCEGVPPRAWEYLACGAIFDSIEDVSPTRGPVTILPTTLPGCPQVQRSLLPPYRWCPPYQPSASLGDFWPAFVIPRVTVL